MDWAHNKLGHVSASQITTWVRCARKHWLEKIGGIVTPTSAGAAFGTRGHAAIEHRIEHGAWPNDPEAVQAAVAGWRFIPPPPLLVEADMRLEDGALPLVGRIDLIAPDSSVVIDHKFLSSFRWAKTPEQLADDPQAILYTTWAWRQGLLRKDALTFRHVVYLTRGQPQAQSQQVLFSPSQLERKFTDLLGTVERMAGTAAERDPACVAGAMESDDPSPCKAYGGCPHQGICQGLLGRSVWQGIEAKKETDMGESLLERLARKKQAQQAQDAGAVNPPEATETHNKRAFGVVAAVNDELNATAQQGLFDGPDQTEPLAIMAAVFDEFARKPEQTADDTSFPPSNAEMSEYYAEQRKQAQTLYVGCMPVNEKATMLETWIAPLLASAAQSLGVAHYGMADYGKGKPALAALVAHKANVEGVPQVMVADPRLPSTDVALEVLRPLYARVVVRFG